MLMSWSDSCHPSVAIRSKRCRMPRSRDPDSNTFANASGSAKGNYFTATFILANPVETDGSVFPARIMLADICTWTYRGDECGYDGPPVADEFDKPTSDPAKDQCSRCPAGCRLRNNIARAGFFISINKLS
ncbi:TPA: phage minor tail protein L [Escherichia coli]|nr:phage minor tail protein L [Escherichia coli]